MIHQGFNRDEHWYNKYLVLYGKPISDVPNSIIEEIGIKLNRKQSDKPLISLVVIAHNEEHRILACLWSLSELETQYPLEIIGINNNSTDKTKEIFQRIGIPYYNEIRQSPGYARQKGLEKIKGKYYFCIDADTIYPPRYVDLMMKKLTIPNVSCVNAFWSFFPDDAHSRIGLLCYETIRDMFLWFQHFQRPELCVRGMVFAFNADYGCQVGFRTDIRRGEDGSLALSLKHYGKIAFLYNRQARPITGYGTIGSKSLLKSFLERVKIQGKGLSRLFYRKDKYEDSDENLIKSGA